MEENLNKLKQFESILKKCLMKRFGSFLPENKIALLNNENFTVLNNINEFKDLKTREEFQGKILRDTLDALLDIECSKNLDINGNSVSVENYGKYLEDGLIEYYSKEVSELFKFDINEIPELKENLEVVTKLKECYKDGLDQEVFNKNAIELLDKEELKDVILTCDTKAINSYLEKNNNISNDIDANNVINETNERKGSVQLVDINEKKHIKYIDADNQTHLVEVHNHEGVEDFYKKKISSLKPDEELNPEEFFNELCSINDEIKLNNTEDVNIDTLNSSQVNMINYVNTSETMQKEIKDNVQELNGVMHSEDANIHVVNNTNDIVYTEDTGNKIDTTIIQDGTNTNNTNVQSNIDMSQRPLTPEEYNELCMRYANNEQLTEAEMDALKRATPELLENSNEMQGGMTLKLGNKTLGFANKASLFYIILITVFVGVFIGALIFSFIN